MIEEWGSYHPGMIPLTPARCTPGVSWRERSGKGHRGVVLASLLLSACCARGDGGPQDESSLAPATPAQIARIEESFAALRGRLATVPGVLPPVGSAPGRLAAPGLSWIESNPGSPVGVLFESQLGAAKTELPWWSERLSGSSSFVGRCLDATGPTRKPYDNGAVLFNRQCSAVARGLVAVLVLRTVAHEPPRVQGREVGPGKITLEAHLVRLPTGTAPPALLGGVRSTYEDTQVRVANLSVGKTPSVRDLERNFYHYALKQLQKELTEAGLQISPR
jgi:hypothetical protein